MARSHIERMDYYWCYSTVPLHYVQLVYNNIDDYWCPTEIVGLRHLFIDRPTATNVQQRACGWWQLRAPRSDSLEGDTAHDAGNVPHYTFVAMRCSAVKPSVVQHCYRISSRDYHYCCCCCCSYIPLLRHKYVPHRPLRPATYDAVYWGRCVVK